MEKNTKKKYQSPIFYMEEFAMSQAIAGNCSTGGQLIADSGDAFSCVVMIDDNENGQWELGENYIFIDGENHGKCELFEENHGGIGYGGVMSGDEYQSDQENNGVVDLYCYHNPEGKVLFAS